MTEFDVKQMADLDRQIRELREQVLRLTETVSAAIQLLDERTRLTRDAVRKRLTALEQWRLANR
jgi:hypothetical protein